MKPRKFAAWKRLGIDWKNVTKDTFYRVVEFPILSSSQIQRMKFLIPRPDNVTP